MGIMSKLGQQWRKPTGWLGGLLVRAMNLNHSKLTDWGLSHISIGKHDTILDVGWGGEAPSISWPGLLQRGRSMASISPGRVSRYPVEQTSS